MCCAHDLRCRFGIQGNKAGSRDSTVEGGLRTVEKQRTETKYNNITDNTKEISKSTGFHIDRKVGLAGYRLSEDRLSNTLPDNPKSWVQYTRGAPNSPEKQVLFPCFGRACIYIFIYVRTHICLYTCIYVYGWLSKLWSLFGSSL